MTYLLALIAAICYGTYWVLQQHEAGRAPTGLQLHPVRLMEHVIRRPLWLVGLVALLGGAAAQEGALVDGSLPIIESLLVLSLVWALVFANRLSHRRVERSQWLGAVMVCIGLAAFLIAGDPTAGDGTGATTRWLEVGVIVSGLFLVLIALAWKIPGKPRAALCATAASIAFGLSDAMSKAAFSLLDDPASFYANWQLYAVIATAVVAVAISQVAYNAAPLVVSLPSLTVGEPVTAVLVGVAALDVHFRTTPAALAVEGVAVVMVAFGSWIVALSPVLDVHGLHPHLVKQGDGQPARSRQPS